MTTLIERIKTGAKYAAGAVVDSARIGAIVLVEPLSRGLFPDSFPISFQERVAILEQCLKVEQLAKIRNDSDQTFDLYSEARGQLMEMLTTERVRQLATFAGVRDPDDIPPIAQLAIDAFDAMLSHVREDLIQLRHRYAHQVEITTMQRKSLAAATSAVLDVAAAGQWTTDLAATIRRIGAERDQLREERDIARNERDELTTDNDNLRALLEGKRVTVTVDGTKFEAKVDGAVDEEQCGLPCEGGWTCIRPKGHEGPCQMGGVACRMDGKSTPYVVPKDREPPAAAPPAGTFNDDHGS